MFKKTIIIFIAAIFVANTSFANEEFFVKDNPAGKMEKIVENKTVTYIVELEGGGLLEKKQTMFSSENSGAFEMYAMREINNIQENALREAQSITGTNAQSRYTYVMNGFAIESDSSLIDELQKIDGVKSIREEQTFYFDAINEGGTSDVPDYTNQDELIGLSEEIREKYTGKEIVIGVIDSEFRYEHEAFQTEPQEKTLTEEKIADYLENKNLVAEKRMEQQNLTNEAFAADLHKNGKVPFVFDYAANDTESSITKSHLHGTHVTAIAAGNSDNFKGVAPDAQVVFMKVSEDGNTGARESNIIAALEDLAILEVDVVNISMGDDNGFITGSFNDIFSAMETEGIAISMSAGNAYRFGSNRLTLGPMAQHPDYGLAASPAAYEYPTSVASKNAYINSGETEEKMSPFSSWGATTDLRLKPEICAIGGKIISAGTNNNYVYMSGTSMAAPQYAGAVGIMLQYLKEGVGETYSKSMRQEIAQKLLASTAEIEYDDSVPVSPRKQGAGVINLTNATNSPALMYSGIKTKVELGEIGDQAEFSFDIQNLSHEKATYNLSSIIMTDAYETNSDNVNIVKGGRLLDNSTITFKVNGSAIESLDIDGYARKTVTASLSLNSEEVSELSAVFTNGFYVEGYIIATETTTGNKTSIPFMGFHEGNNSGWKDAPFFNGDITDAKPGYIGYTGLYSNRASGINFLTQYTDASILHYTPNGNAELVMFCDNLRNLRKIDITITDSDGNEINKKMYYVPKNHTMYKTDSLGQLYYNFSPYNGVVLANSQNPIADGSYTVEYTATLEYDNETTETGSFNLYVDSVYPKLVDVFYKKDDEKAYLYAKGIDNAVNPYICIIDGTNQEKEYTRYENGYFIFDVKGYDVTSCKIVVADAANNAVAYRIIPANGYAVAYKNKVMSRLKSFDALVSGGMILNEIDFAPESEELVQFFAWDSLLKPLAK